MAELSKAEPALYGVRVEIPRRWRQAVPIGVDLIAGPNGKHVGGLSAAGGFSGGPGTQLPPGGSGGSGGGGGSGGSGGAGGSGGGVGGSGDGGGGVVPGGSPSPSPSPILEPQVVNRTTVSVHFTDEMSGGTAATEMRVYGPIARPFRISSLSVIGISGTMVGQYLDVLVSPDGDTTDTVTPSGLSVFPYLEGMSSLPAQDQPIALPWMAGAFRVPGVFLCVNSLQHIKFRSYYSSPATALPVGHVVCVVEELVLPDYLTSVQPRVMPVPGPGPAPQPIPEPSPSPTPTSSPYAQPIFIAWPNGTVSGTGLGGGVSSPIGGF